MFKALGDSGILVYLPTEAQAVALASAIKARAFLWLEDAVPAYCSVGVFFNPSLAQRRTVQAAVEFLTSELSHHESPHHGVQHVIPVRYDLGEDWDYVVNVTKLRRDEIIQLHTGTVYTVHAIGFVPGFPYLGYLPERLCGVPRLPSPRVRVEPGSVGLTGRQTGIYPLPRPGGWPLIGRTDFKLVDLETSHFPLTVGDKVRFVAV